MHDQYDNLGIGVKLIAVNADNMYENVIRKGGAGHGDEYQQ